MSVDSPTKSLQNPLLKMPPSMQDYFPSTPGKVSVFFLEIIVDGSALCDCDYHRSGEFNLATEVFAGHCRQKEN